MDLYVERQCIDQMKAEDPKKFLMLFGANFASLYTYVARRVEDSAEVEKIVRLTFLDALGQIQNTPTDVNFSTWLYSLAKPRVWGHIDKASMPEKRGLIHVEASEGELETVARVEKMMNKLTLKEREILRLKFFEQVADGDVMMILELEEGDVGQAIYRVLKRAHFLLFGESDGRQGVYFGELSGLLEKMRNLENIESPEVFKLTLKTDLMGRIDRHDLAIDAEVVNDQKERDEARKFSDAPGAGDPAKVFVEAVKEMRDEEKWQLEKEQLKLERKEQLMDIFEKFRWVLVLVPVFVFLIIAGYVWFNISEMWGIKRGYPNLCEVTVDFAGDFADGEHRSIDRQVNDALCGEFEVKDLIIKKQPGGDLKVLVDAKEASMEYEFVLENNLWRVQSYARDINSND